MEINFQAHRPYLHAVAHRMLGSATEADDAVQEAWLRLDRTDEEQIRDVRAWLTTVIARICLDMLRTRTVRGETPLDTPPPAEHPGPEQDTIMADSVGVALLVVLDTLTPAERLAFVLHDLFDVPFDQVATILGRSTPAAKMLASRARHRVRSGAAGHPGPADRQRVAEAFLAAARNGDFAALLALLDPEATARADAYAAPQAATRLLRGAETVARHALSFAARARHAAVGRVNGSPAILVRSGGRLVTVLTLEFAGDRISAIEIVADPGTLESFSSS